MGNADTKLNFRKAVVQLTSKTQVLKHLIFVLFVSLDIFMNYFYL